MNRTELSLGACYQGSNRCAFRVWAPTTELVELHLTGPDQRFLPLSKHADGYHRARLEEIAPGTDYQYRLDGQLERPDPASRWQPHGVHGPSRVFDPEFAWTDSSWVGLPLRNYVLYELHVGAYAAEGTFDAILPHLHQLKELGITALELMPVAQFPGTRNWGYDGVYPFAVQNSYGGPHGLQRLVNAAHQHGLAVVLDVVYNHLGPEGNYLPNFGPYFTDRYHTPWGPAVNFDGPQSDEVRRFFTENALYWQTQFHIDALRLDAVHAIRDFSAIPFLEELAETCHRQAETLGRRFHLIAESDLNMARHILPRTLGGYGLDAQWSDDFHHGLHVLLTGEQTGYYADFAGVSHWAKTWREGYAYTGEYSRHRRRRHGSSPRQNHARQFVVCSQNHDQIGNRMLGDRLSATLSFEQQKLAAAAVLLSPFIPLLFMGEEYGETAPFQYFVSHTDPALVEAVRRGRKEEFAAFAWQGDVPDPQDAATFQRSKLNHPSDKQTRPATLQALYRELITLRKQVPALADAEKETLETTPLEADNVLLVREWCGADQALLLFHFGSGTRSIELPIPEGTWRKSFDTTDPRWAGPGASTPAEISGASRLPLDLPPSCCVLYLQPAPA